MIFLILFPYAVYTFAGFACGGSFSRLFANSVDSGYMKIMANESGIAFSAPVLSRLIVILIVIVIHFLINVFQIAQTVLVDLINIVIVKLVNANQVALFPQIIVHPVNIATQIMNVHLDAIVTKIVQKIIIVIVHHTHASKIVLLVLQVNIVIVPHMNVNLDVI